MAKPTKRIDSDDGFESAFVTPADSPLQSPTKGTPRDSRPVSQAVSQMDSQWETDTTPNMRSQRMSMDSDPNIHVHWSPGSSHVIEDGMEGEELKENKVLGRGQWRNKLEFILSCLGYAVGLGNVWRFPHLAYTHGGGAFFIPYFTMLLLIGIPTFFLELTLGQFTSLGPTSCWQFAQLFQGVGFAMTLVSSYITIYYQMVIAWALYYFVMSFTSELPWATCQEPWMTKKCGKYPSVCDYNQHSCEDCDMLSNTTDGTCRDNSTGEVKGIYDTKLSKGYDEVHRVLPATEYFARHVLGNTEGNNLTNLGSPQPYLILCLCICWIITALALSKGIKSAGKVVYVTAVAPYFILTVLLVKGLTLEGSTEGILFYLTPKLEKLLDTRVWKEAAIQIFFSLSVSAGGLVALSSYNDFHNDIFKDAMIVAIGNCMTSLFAGLVIFSYLGFLAKQLGQPIGQVATGGPSLAFEVYPSAIAQMWAPPVWSVLFFLMLLNLGVNSQFVAVETVLTAIKDMFPGLRAYKARLTFAVCIVLFLLGIPQCFSGGADVVGMFDSYATGWNSFIISFMTLVSVAWVYGADRFLYDVHFMLGHDRLCCMKERTWRTLWKIMWSYISPVVIFSIFISTVIQFKKHKFDEVSGIKAYIGLAMSSSAVVLIVGVMVYRLCTTQGTYRQRFAILLNPNDKWGPADPATKYFWQLKKPEFE